MATIALLAVDSKRPNLALMKIAAHPNGNETSPAGQTNAKSGGQPNSPTSLPEKISNVQPI